MLHENWQKYKAGGTHSITHEYPIYSDISYPYDISDLLNTVNQCLGSLSFHNAVPFNKRTGEVVISIIVRVSFFEANEDKNCPKPKDSSYHGGWIKDEIAALMSLILGARFHAGDSIRFFGSLSLDPLGTPHFSGLSQPPVSYIKEGRHILPEVAKSKTLDKLKILTIFPELSQETAGKLIQCARQYQNALWLSESNPEMCWLLLVSALEIAANQWSASKSNNIDNLKSNFKDLYNFISTFNSDELIEKTANTFAPVTKSTAKFINFCMAHAPKSLEQEKSAGFALSDLEASLKIIYNYRSQALHSGIPFPSPMCMPPRVGENLCQKPSRYVARTYNTVWLEKDLPMNLHFFHYLTRCILINWLENLKPKG